MKLGGFVATWQSLVAVLLNKTKFTLQLVLLFIELTKVGTRVEEIVASLTTILEEDKKREKEIQVWYRIKVFFLKKKKTEHLLFSYNNDLIFNRAKMQLSQNNALISDFVTSASGIPDT